MAPIVTTVRRGSGRKTRDEIDQLKKRVAQLEETLAITREAVQEQSPAQAFAEIKPRRLPPPGKTAMQMISGQWPGDETTEELLKQLKELD